GQEPAAADPRSRWPRATVASGRDPLTPSRDAMNTPNRKRLVIIGGGFAGITLAEAVEHKLPPDWDLTLVSQENFITYNPLLPEVVGASLLPGHVIAPHRQMIHCSHVCMARVTEIDTVNRVIHYLGEGAG